MSGLADILGGALGGDAISKIAGQLGTDEATAKAGIGVALPKLLGQLQANASQPAGAEALANAVNKDHDGSLLDDLGGFIGGGFTNGPGDKILGKVFGRRRMLPSARSPSSAGSGPTRPGASWPSWPRSCSAPSARPGSRAGAA